LTYDKDTDVWRAERDGFSFQADNPIELIGLASIYLKLQPKEAKEYWWRINDPDIIGELDK
jgi:hypothetical protein